MGESLRLAPFFADLAAIFRKQYKKAQTDRLRDQVEIMVADAVETYDGLPGFDHHAFINEVYGEEP